MATLAESLVSSTSRPLLLRVRPDLSAKRHKYQGNTYWVVKEPVGLNYFRFHEEEYAILNMLDGRTSLDEIKEAFEQQFAPQKITFQDLLQFVGMLHRSGLVISESTGQGQQLVKRRNEKKYRELMGKLANVFALRFRGVDPERFLNWLYKYTGWFFTWPAVVCVLLFAASAGVLVAVQFDTFSEKLPTFHEFFSARNWIWLAITMGVVKVLHEFGHGLSCKHFGGECHELGAMMLVFTPALYCNVSDSWMLPNKWHRAAIGAAGMYVELFLASIATYLWWFSSPGMFNQICLSVMFICSVSTIVFNGNPLLRFDGYYILMDLLEIPNLRQKSTEVLKRYALEYCMGIEQPENPFLPQGNRWLFALYTIAAVIYRWVVVFSILFFLNRVFEPYGLKVLGQLIALSGFVGLIVQPVYQLWKFFYTPGSLNKVKMNRIAATVGIAAAALAFVLFVPLPFSVNCSFEIEGKEAQQVMPAVPGQIVQVFKKPGDTVKKGDPIIQLENPELELQMQELETSYALAKLSVETLETQVSIEGIERLAQAKEQLESAEKQLAEKQKEKEQLTIRAGRDGIIFPAPEKADRSASAEQRLPSWTGSPFSAKNQGALLTRTDLICQIGDPSDLEALLVIDQAYVDLVKDGQDVALLLDANTGRSIKTKVDRIAHQELKAAPPAMTTKAGGRLDTITDKTGQTKLISASYPAHAHIGEQAGAVQIGLQGQAHIYTGWQSIRSRLYRYLTKTFHFDL